LKKIDLTTVQGHARLEKASHVFVPTENDWNIFSDASVYQQYLNAFFRVGASEIMESGALSHNASSEKSFGHSQCFTPSSSGADSRGTEPAYAPPPYLPQTGRLYLSERCTVNIGLYFTLPSIRRNT